MMCIFILRRMTHGPYETLINMRRTTVRLYGRLILDTDCADGSDTVGAGF